MRTENDDKEQGQKNRLLLTKTKLDTLRIPSKAEAGKVGYVSFWDTAVTGFGVLVRPSGLKTFVLSYRNAAGRSRRLTLGRYGRITVDQARAVAKQKNGEVALGGDPTADKKEVRQASTVDELFTRYIAEHLATECSIDAVRSGKRTQKLVRKTLGHRLVHEVEDTDVNVALKPYRTQGGNYNMIRAYVSSAWTWGRLNRVIPKSCANPTEGIEPMPSTPQAREITNAEYKAVFGAIDVLLADRKNDPARILACLFTIFTGCRPVDAIRLKRDKIFRDRGVAELHEHKLFKRTKKPKLFFLTEPILDLFDRADALHTLRGVECEYVFPRRSKQKPSQWLAKTWAAIKAKAGVDIDLRQFRSGYINVADDAGLTEQETADTTQHASLTVIRRHYKVVAQKRAKVNAERIATALTAKRGEVVDLAAVRQAAKSA